jgi:hypothetical protein
LAGGSSVQEDSGAAQIRRLIFIDNRLEMRSRCLATVDYMADAAKWVSQLTNIWIDPFYFGNRSIT